MKNFLRHALWGLKLVMVGSSCVEPFDIESIGLEDLLVVEGFITDEMGEQKVTLSRTIEIDQFGFIPETAASVRIVDQEGQIVELFERTDGEYFTPSDFHGIPGKAYYLEIQTDNGGQYVSSEVVLKSTPAIDSVYGRYYPPASGRSIGIEFFLDTHDPQSQSQFFRWEWEGTYEIITPLDSKFDWIQGNQVVRREIPVNRCFALDRSSEVLIKSTESLELDVVTEYPLHFVPGGQPDMKVKYSMYVRQYSLSREAYLFWEGLKVQNENSGSLFDVQPAAVVGNIRSLSHPGEMVLGYFDASEVKTTRRFFTPEDFAQQGYIPPSDNVNCQIDTVAINAIGVYMESLRNSPTPREIHDISVNKFLVAPRFCTDCSNRGDVSEPEFWE